jgi:hypothetical protein
VTHDHIVLLVILTFALEVAGLIWAAIAVNRMLRESQRFTRLLAGLVVQESEKVQALVRDLRPS